MRLFSIRVEAGYARDLSMNVVWIVVGAAAVGVVVRLVAWSHGRARQADLGSVSHSWIAEHRLSQTQDSNR
jgi:hypothetical protein